MTHEADCSIKSSAKADIERIAECFYYETEREIRESSRRDIDHWADIDPAEEDCVAMAKDLGMTFLGSGVARSTFSVVPDDPMKSNEESEVTAFAECVVKFARYGRDNLKDGRAQMREEIGNFEKLPPKLVSGEGGRPPVFVPLKDYDDMDYLWATAPLAPPPGSIHEVEDRMNRLGWRADDLHGDNVGSYPDHGDSAVIDYGLTVEQIAVDLTREFDQIKSGLKARDALDITEDNFERGGGGIEFYPDEQLPGDEKPSQKSHFLLDRDGFVESIDVFFPGFPRSMFSKTEMRAEMDRMDYEPGAIAVRRNDWVDAGRDYIAANIEIEPPRGDPLPPDMAIDEYVALEEAYDDHFAQFIQGYRTDTDAGTGAQEISKGVQGITVAGEFEDKQAQWRNALEGIGMRNVKFPGPPEADIEFHAPLDNVPHPSVRASQLWWFSAANVAKVTYRAAEITVTPNTRADARSQVMDIADTVDGMYENAPVAVGGTIRHQESDPATEGQIYDVIYEMRWVADYINPDTTISVLNTITKKHNQNFNPTPVTR